MSSLRRFKWQRAIPGPLGSYLPGFQRYSTTNMRQLPITTQTYNSGDPAEYVVQTIVPKGTWAQTKVLRIRWAWHLVPGSGPKPGGFTVEEGIAIAPIGTYTLPSPAFAGAPVTNSSSVEQVAIVRTNQDSWTPPPPGSSDIFAWDEWSTLSHSRVNQGDGTEWFFELGSAVPDNVFASELLAQITVYMPTPWPGCSLHILWAEAFLEQGVNLGALT